MSQDMFMIQSKSCGHLSSQPRSLNVLPFLCKGSNQLLLSSRRGKSMTNPILHPENKNTAPFLGSNLAFVKVVWKKTVCGMLQTSRSLSNSANDGFARWLSQNPTKPPCSLGRAAFYLEQARPPNFCLECNECKKEARAPQKYVNLPPYLHGSASYISSSASSSVS